MQPIPEDWQRAVAVVAHPDDLEYGLATAVARWTGQGKDVAYVLATSGEAGIDGMAPEQAGPLREEEERRRRRGGRRVARRVPRPSRRCTSSTASRCGATSRAAFRRLRPDVVITMNFDLTWGDGGGSTTPTIAPSGSRRSTRAATRPIAGCSPSWATRGRASPTAYVAAMTRPRTTSTSATRSRRAWRRSQEHRAYIEGLGTDFDPEEFLTSMAGFGGMAAGCEFAVLFRRFEV